MERVGLMEQREGTVPGLGPVPHGHLPQAAGAGLNADTTRVRMSVIGWQDDWGINGQYRSTECPRHTDFQSLVQWFWHIENVSSSWLRRSTIACTVPNSLDGMYSGVFRVTGGVATSSGPCRLSSGATPVGAGVTNVLFGIHLGPREMCWGSPGTHKDTLRV